MGDELGDDDFLAEDIHGSNDEDVNDDVEEVSLPEEEGEDEDAGQQKANKKKRKFAELKAKIKERQASAGEEAENSAARETEQLQPADMAQILEEAKAKYGRPTDEISTSFEDEDFFYPGLAASSVTESTTKKLCPFVRALSASMPNYRVLLGPASGSSSVAPEDNGSPLVLIVCASALRATEVIRGINAKLSRCKIAKLFGKHIKVSEQMKVLTESHHPIAIGTPHRVQQLLELGALSLRRLVLCLVDVTPDAKNFTALTQADVARDLLMLLHKYLHPERNHCRLALVKDSPLEAGKNKKDRVIRRLPDSHKHAKSHNQKQQHQSQKQQQQKPTEVASQSNAQQQPASQHKKQRR